MSEAQAAPQAPAQQTQAQPNAQAAQPQGAGAAGTVGSQASPSPAKEAAQEAMRRHRLKVDGEEIEVDDEELKRGYGLQKVSTKRMQEGMAAKKQAEEFIKMMKDKGKLFEAIKNLGHDPRTLAEEYLANEIKLEMMDPRDRENMELKRQLQQIKEMDEMQKKAVEEKRVQVLKEKFTKEYEAQFVEALKASSLPPTKETVQEMAKYIARSAKLGYKLSADEAAKLVKEDIEERHRKLYGESDAETLARLLGPDGLQKLREFELKKLKNPEAELVTPKEQPESLPKKRDGWRMSPREWREFNRK